MLHSQIICRHPGGRNVQEEGKFRAQRGKKKAVVLVFIRIYKMKCFHSLRASVEKDDDL